MTPLSLILLNAAHHAAHAAETTELAGGTMDIPVITHSIIPGHALAQWILNAIDTALNALGLSHDHGVEEVIYTIVVLGVAIVIGIALRRGILFVVRKIVALGKGQTERELLSEHTFRKCSHFIPPLIFLGLIPFAFKADHETLRWIMRCGVVYAVVTFGIALSALLEFGWGHFNKYDNRDNHPLKGVLNVCKGVVWIVVFIVSVAVLVDRSPMALLAGLGAFAAALMLIFKDSILGFVAGIQLSTNDMIRVGDWIIVPNTLANGTVIDVTLTVVKVQNWDNTIVMVPPYTLVSGSFQNWRHIYEIGYRQISMVLYVDNATICAATPELLASLSEAYPDMKEYIAGRQAVAAKGENPYQYNNIGEANGTIDTNLGLFRYYVWSYLLNHPEVMHDQWILVTLNQAQSYGAALNVYFYSRQTSWEPYEAVLCEIMEHIHAAAPAFGLKIYNAPNANAFTVTTSAK